MCTRHNVDLECIETDDNGNPEGALYRIQNYKHALEGTIARRFGIIDADGAVLKPGTRYLFDFSSFACPTLTIPEGLSSEEEDNMYCGDSWTAQIEEVSENAK